MARVSKDEIRTLREGFEAANEELEVVLDMREWPDELVEAFGQADEILDTISDGGHVDAGDAEVLRESLGRARHELEVILDMRDWPDELIEALDGADELIRTLAPVAPLLAPVSSPAPSSPAAGDDELTQTI